MKEIAQLINDRLTGDTTGTGNLQDLLGGSGRIYAGIQGQLSKAPSLTFEVFTAVPNPLGGDRAKVFDYFYQFSSFSDRSPEIMQRLRRLFDAHCFTVPAGYGDIGALRSVWDWEGPALFDEQLKVARRDARYRFYAVPKAVNPV